ncbi:MAG: ATP-binding protein [Candidatus Methanomethylophilaceae archaeon]|nr:ATP-binding protein [Candidatus Methanomethylophilaceae archaeon]
MGKEYTISGRWFNADDGTEIGVRSYPYAEIQLIHSFKDADVDQKMLSFPLDIESAGIVEMFSLMGPVAKALKEGRTLIIDEFGANLHPLLNRWMVGLFNYASNDNGAQLIVNTHDLCLMDIEEVFRRDQIWLTNKCRYTGACGVYSLADIKGVRKTTDVRKEYLMGRYDALPKIVGVRVL